MAIDAGDEGGGQESNVELYSPPLWSFPFLAGSSGVNHDAGQRGDCKTLGGAPTHRHNIILY